MYGEKRKMSDSDGITPACAGKSPPPTSQKRPSRDHPRMERELGKIMRNGEISEMQGCIFQWMVPAGD